MNTDTKTPEAVKRSLQLSKNTFDDKTDMGVHRLVGLLLLFPYACVGNEIYGQLLIKQCDTRPEGKMENGHSCEAVPVFVYAKVTP